MKAIGEIISTYQGVGGELISLVKWKDRRLGSELEKIPDGQLEITIKELGKARSLRQNAMLWEIINRICESPDAPSANPFDMYCNLLTTAGAKVTPVRILSNAVSDLRKVSGLRVLQVVSTFRDDDGKEWCDCLLYMGSSTMNTKEMTKLIDTAIWYAEELGIPTGDLDGI